MTTLILDQWASCTLAPTSTPFELSIKGGVFRGMSNLDDACAYADKVMRFFDEQGARNKVVFVVKGPTSTTKSAFEVCCASAGYTILYQAKATTKTPRP